MKDKYLVILHKIAPFSWFKQLVIWFKLKRKLRLGLFYAIDNYIKVLGLAFITAVLTLTTITTRANIVVLEAEKTGWSAIINNENELIVSAVNPMIVEKTEVCVLWVKDGEEITMLAKLPEYGKQNIILDEKLVSNIKNLQVLISIEDKDDITTPLVLEYQGVAK